MNHPLFANRRDAGRRLARALKHFRGMNAVVLALPRGGVPVGFEVARALDADFDLLLVRKIGVPGHEELAMGAVVDGASPQLVLNQEILDLVPLPPGYMEMAEKGQLAEIERRRHLYLGGASAIVVEGRAVIVVDDGIATGATMKAALRGIRRSEPHRLVLAVPVAPRSSIDALAAECDEIVALEMPEPFRAVGPHYADFTQTTDDEVIQLLTTAREHRPGGSDRASSKSPPVGSR
jgi:putative phosphoribosyl transferase